LQGDKISLADIQAAAWILAGDMRDIVSTVPGIPEWCARLSPLLQSKGKQGFVDMQMPRPMVTEKMQMREIGIEESSLPVIISAKTDLLYWGYLPDDRAICVSPLSHSLKVN